MAMNTKTFPRAVAYSLGTHGLALALIIMGHGNGINPGHAPETVPFIHASLVYAMNGRSDQQAPVLPHSRKDRTIRTVSEPVAPRPAADEVNDRETPAKIATQGVRTEPAQAAGADASVSLHLPSLKSMETKEIAAIGKASGEHPVVGRRSGSPRSESGQMILPRYLNATRPAYPLIARMRGYEGMVLLAVEVLEDGRAGDVRVKQSSGYALLDKSALDAVRAWRFEPARKMETPLTMTVDIPIRFALNEAN